VIETVQAVLTAAATLTGIYVAVAGLNAWRRETLGRRDLEMCQDVIVSFYEAEQRIRVLRSPVSSSAESVGRPKGEHESESETHLRDIMFVPLARVIQQQDFWVEFFSRRYKMRAMFGGPAEKPFADVDEALWAFRAAAQTRYLMIHGDRLEMDPSTARKLEAAIWAADPKDEISTKVRSAIEAMERICAPVVRGKRQGWEGLTLFRR
jgi:hypothetical protein